MQLQSEVEDASRDARNAEEKAKKAITDVWHFLPAPGQLPRLCVIKVPCPLPTLTQFPQDSLGPPAGHTWCALLPTSLEVRWPLVHI